MRYDDECKPRRMSTPVKVYFSKISLKTNKSAC